MKQPIRSYRDLEVWQTAVDLAVAVYESSTRLPGADRFRLGDQLIRAAISVAANIAEGHGRRRPAEYIRFVDIANGSLCELETQLEICRRVRALDSQEVEELMADASRIGQMLVRLRQRLQQVGTRTTRPGSRFPVPGSR